MDELQLILPDETYAEEIMSFRQETLQSGDEDAFAGCSGLENCDTAETWLALLQEYANGIEGRVPSTTYLAVRIRDRRLVGIIDLRHHINHPILSLWGGHIGYSVRPSERGKGYAREMLRLQLQNCAARGLQQVMVTCSNRNPASERTILANGGQFERDVEIDGETVRRYWITLA